MSVRLPPRRGSDSLHGHNAGTSSQPRYVDTVTDGASPSLRFSDAATATPVASAAPPILCRPRQRRLEIRRLGAGAVAGEDRGGGRAPQQTLAEIWGGEEGWRLRGLILSV